MKSKNYAFLVGLGIFFSRISGLIRERVFAHYFGSSDAGDAFKAALKIPNFLQNLFGEGVLSASFIPVYSKLLAEKHEEEASQVARVILTLLFVLVSVLVLIGVLITPYIIDFIAPGFNGEKKDLTILIVQIFFPGTGLLVLSAWCLGVLNSHKSFFLSYAAPVVWNIFIIITMIASKWYFPELPQNKLAVFTAWGLVAGSALQFLVQWPFAKRFINKIYLNFDFSNSYVKKIIHNFSSVFISRGVVQVSAYIDMMIASLLQSGAVSAIAYAQTLYLLPVSLFGMSISASELPQMSQLTGAKQDIYEEMKLRLKNSIEKVTFFVIPSVVAFVVLGQHIVKIIFETGAFTHDTTKFVWLVLCGSSFGLVASTVGRLFSASFYALQDAKTPLKFALVRVFLTTVFGILFSIYLPKMMFQYIGEFQIKSLTGFSTEWSVFGLTFSAGIAGWVEYYYLRNSLENQIGKVKLENYYQIKLWFIAIVASIVSLLCVQILKDFKFSSVFVSFIGLIIFGLIYFLITYLFKNSISINIFQKFFRLK